MKFKYLASSKDVKAHIEKAEKNVYNKLRHEVSEGLLMTGDDDDDGSDTCTLWERRQQCRTLSTAL